MKRQFKQRPLAVLLIVLCFLVTIIGTGIAAAMAESTSLTEDRSIFYGKVTAIDGTAVTVAIGTVTMPVMPQQNGSADSQGANQNSAPKGTPPADGSGFQGGGRMNFADSLTLTGELVTVQITDQITVTKQGARPSINGTDGTPPQGNGQGGTAQPDGQQPPQGQGPQGMFGFGFAGEAASLSDIAVDNIVILTYQTSTQQLLSVHILSTPEASST